MVRFEIYEDQVGEYRWRLVAGNNEVVAASEGYSSKQGAINSAQNVKYWANSASIQDIT
jgi:uncharacterized protein